MEFFKLRILEMVGVTLIITSFFYIISLLSYHPLDQAGLYGFDNNIQNILGSLGVYVAALMLEIFGLASYLLGLYMFVWGVCFLAKKQDFFFPYRAANGMFSLCFLSIVLAEFDISSSWDHLSYGGYVGSFIFDKFIVHVSEITIVSISTLLFIVCLSESLDISLTFYKKCTLPVIKQLIINAISFFRHVKKIKGLFAINVAEFFQKRFNKKRIKDVDTRIVKRKKTIQKLAKEFNTGEAQTFFQYKLPDVDLLTQSVSVKQEDGNRGFYKSLAKQLQATLEDFGISGKICDIKPGPVVTLFEFEPSPGVKSSRIIGLSDDVARSMSAVSARIAVIPGRNALGIELPNKVRKTVYLRELIESAEYKSSALNLPLALGQDISGAEVMADLSKMPHLLVAGTTGSGKSVAINTMILSIIFKLSPEQCKFIMIDPKMLELSVYNGIPHLLSPVITDAKKAIHVLQWVVTEMENRYKLMSSLGVRNISGYNEKVKEAVADGTKLTKTVQTGFDPNSGNPTYEEVELDMTPLPFIVVIIDEMADLMIVAGKEIESYLQRIAQMARAAGIHMIVATQRPSVDVITGVIKANFPTRISFQVTSKIDSRTILGDQGAEQLLGMGDMLYMHGGSKVIRVHGPFISDDEVAEITKELKQQGSPTYVEDIMSAGSDADDSGGDSGDQEGDELYQQAVDIVLKEQKVSISYIQRQLRIGYNRSANIVEEMERRGIISAAGNTGRREVLVEK
ncbi:MAG: DNA translocase FtsK [Rickettsiales bacterium]|jgi:DNA segregation ATPase FtsK/SpoIIIE, S-DNA-T family|nr:DNA translocase FtsK [Rickettsiales bacterium]